MHLRVKAWVLASCAAPAALVLATVAGMVFKQGLGVLLTALSWQVLIGFIFLTLSMAAFSPVLLLPLERKTLPTRATTTLTALALIVGIGFMASALVGPLALSIALGLLLDALVFFLIVTGPHRTGVPDHRQASRLSA